MKALAILTFAFLALNVSYAGYGEDMKGECKNGKGSTRGQEELVVSGDSEVKVKEKSVKGK